MHARLSSRTKLPLTVNDIAGCNSFCGITAVDDELCASDDIWVIVAGVIGHDHHAVKFFNLTQRRAGHLKIVMTAASHRREKGIVVADAGASLLQQFDDR